MSLHLIHDPLTDLVILLNKNDYHRVYQLPVFDSRITKHCLSVNP